MQTLTIGRDPANQIVLDDKLVSRFHAQLILPDNSQAKIKDLGSSNGTFVNGNRTSESYLNPGDIVKCGPVFLNWAQYVQGIPGEARVDLVSIASKAQEWNDNILITFIKPFLGTIDTGAFFRKVFSGLYLVIAVLNILFPLYLLFKLIDDGLFKSEGKYVFLSLIIWLILMLLGWFGFQLWWNRKEKVNQSSYSGAEFVATPALAHFIQTLGEWYGVVTGVCGFIGGLLSLLLTDYYSYSYKGGVNDFFLPLPLIGTGWALIFLGPIAGFFIVLLFRFISEAIKSLTVIANNTKVNK